MIWDLTDGEMVIDAVRWRKTHGFGDCILAHADHEEFQVIHALAQKGRACDSPTLAKMLRVDVLALEGWLARCQTKKLVVASGNTYRLHLEKPRLDGSFATRLGERLATQSHASGEALPQRFSLAEIERMAQAAFGAEFVVRQATEIYLPVHCLVVKHPDGSLHSSHWNALNGKRLNYRFFN